MRCPFCNFPDSRVLDSRPADDGCSIRRRRECGGCGRRFTTYERVDELPLVVVKKDGRREVFDRNKLLTGLVKACQKRPVPMATLEALVDELERALRSTAELEVPSRQIGEMVMERLRLLDEVAYVRFASVYREFRDVQEFLREIQRLSGKSGAGSRE
ncbi:transcriptional repressor NrdR [Desulfofundulus thermobenzoicus]|uniref:Transcriptional repressor NrdR n=1 Tax=Desulfofundulus thermobenzoicus TaxID=29376 RepID=A0A6N7ITB4_9FIRM|nr:transcriptional regulator NrdR [Desulfofundulus thermobenzoicus]MQL53171.1 transcriptional repressor NrdR [Desulfofundulus thermobenzoicus]HHW43048.1 transcriptional repressor NrdR [Desulfotomaculum sp.]